MTPDFEVFTQKGRGRGGPGRNLTAQVEAGGVIVATASLWSQNEKLGAAASTTAAQASCPSSCPFLDGGGCYAESGALGSFVTKPLNVSARRAGIGPRSVALAEARAIDALRPGRKARPLRLHIVGDCSTPASARVVAAAAERYMERGGGQAWTYTHAWRVVPREAWGRVSVLASCESPAETEEAHALGYAASLTVEDFPTHRRYLEGGAQVIPCPAQTRGVVCSDCRLCFNEERLYHEGLVIGFAVHGDGFAVAAARRTLRGEPRRPSSRAFVEGFLDEHGRPPTIAQVVEATGVGESSAWQMIRRVAGAVAQR